jgi:hypothetical protein
MEVTGLVRDNFQLACAKLIAWFASVKNGQLLAVPPSLLRCFAVEWRRL